MRPRRVLFLVIYAVTIPILQTGADLASLYRRFPSWRPVIFLAWLPIRGLGTVLFRACEVIAE